ncbi:MAG: adenylate/guanylate cyclase domain-containing protein [Betaproteobacteria bacterium]|nr:MAG: adenylate/guanylate cyclase domain-containing protein [Betaproteobacteria bacterium]
MAEQVSEAAVLFADVSGSTKLYETAGDTVAHAAIEKCVNLMREKTVNAKGRVIKTIGDEVMSAFATADQAADAAIEIQSAISEMPPVGNTQIGVRIGFNHGPVVERDGDVFGDAVNLAARLAGVATKGQIITARDTVMLMSPMLKAATRAITTIQVKGKAQEIQVYELIWQQSEDMTTLASQKSVYKPKNAKLRLMVQGNEVILSSERPGVALGRDASADLVIKERMASRAHGKIERRLDKFILTDHSANGTFITIEGDKEIVLRREEFTLRGHGWIAFGQSRATATDVLEFFCE